MDDLDAVQQALGTIQNQIDSLADVVLQNRRAIVLLTAQQGGTCLFLGEEYCYYTN